MVNRHDIGGHSQGDPLDGSVVSARGVRRAYGSHEVLRGVDLEVREGEILALLGPNGAGKTTFIEILEGYRHRDGGEVSVLGVDPARPTLEWRSRIGLVLQDSVLPAELTVEELVRRWAGYYPDPLGVGETIDLVGLSDRASVRAGRLSGGQQRRLDVALALVGDPELIFLDEPTTGFDPAARRSTWEMIAGLRDLGKTVLLTTHYMEEAEFLADTIAILSGGRIAVTGDPLTIGGRDRAPATIRFVTPPGFDPALLGEVEVATDGPMTVVTTADPVSVLEALTGWARRTGTDLAGLEVLRPTLEDVYLGLVGES